jgi:hypothetical protein
MLPNGAITSNVDTYGVDFGAVLSFTAAMGGPVELVADLLPAIEAILIRSSRAESEA